MAPEDSPQTPPRQKVYLDEVLEQAHVESGREVPLTRIGYDLARLLFVYLAVVSVVLLVDYLWNAPAPPDTASLDKTKLEAYQQLSEIYTTRLLDLFDLFVVKSFLPVFTAVLGYIFGSRVERDNS